MTQNRVEVNRSGVSETKGFSIKAGAHAFKILSDGLYTDKVLAVVRELSSNAWDAHVSAGNTNKPFDVHLPNQFEPFFSIRDYGTGLSHEDVMNLYSTYFDSNKGNSNDFTGGLGLGSKSPFSLVESFTVTSYFKGTKRIYLIDLGDAGVPQVSLVDGYPVPTTKPDGLEINLSVDKSTFRSFKEKAESLYKYYPLEPNVKGNSDYCLNKPEYLLSGDFWGIREKKLYDDERVIAIQGTVGYPIDIRQVNSEGKDYLSFYSSGFDIHFDIGELDITANREGLSYDERTKQNICNKFDVILKEIKSLIQKEIDGCSSYWDAVKTIANFRDKNYFFNKLITDKFIKELSFKGRELVRGIIGIKTPKNVELKYNKIGTLSIKTLYSGSNFSFSPQTEKVFADDLKNGGVSRFRHALKSYSCGTLVRYKDESDLDNLLDLIGLPKSEVIFTSTLDKPPRKSKSSGSSANKDTVDVYFWEGGVDSLNSLRYWKNIKVDLDGEYYYVPTCRKELNVNLKIPSLLKYAINNNIIKESDILYSVPEHKINRVSKSKGNWINLLDKVKDHLQKSYKGKFKERVSKKLNFRHLNDYSDEERALKILALSKKVKQNKLFSEFFEKFDFIDKEFIEETNLNLELCTAFDICKYDITVNVLMFSKEVKPINDKYPLIPHLLKNTSSYNFENSDVFLKVVDYINLVDKAS